VVKKEPLFMAKQMPMTQKEAIYFFDVIYDPLVQHIRSLPELKGFLTNRRQYQALILMIGEFYGYVMRDPDMAKKSIEQLLALLKHRHISDRAAYRLVYYTLKVMCDSFLKQPTLGPRLEAAQKNAQALLAEIEEIYGELVQETPSDEVLFTLHSEHGGEHIDQLHTSGEHTEVMTAQDYLALGELDEEEILELMDNIQDTESIILHSIDLDNETLEELTAALEHVVHAIEKTAEFVELGEVVRQFQDLLNEVKAIDEMERQNYLPIATNFIADLKAWADHVFVKQDAIDIHYLDAALMAAIKQIELMLKAPQEDEIPEEDFLF